MKTVAKSKSKQNRLQNILGTLALLCFVILFVVAGCIEADSISVIGALTAFTIDIWVMTISLYYGELLIVKPNKRRCEK